MQKVLSAAEMREVDRLTKEKYGIPSVILMENAAHACARIITEKLGGSVAKKTFLILCGKGNNGGDGAALARILWTQGASVWIFLFGKVEDTKDDARVNFEIAKKIADENLFLYGMNYFYLTEVEDYRTYLEETKNLREDVCIDALFGTGLTRKVEGDLENVIGGINHWIPGGRASFIVSLDLPSGLNADSPNLYSIDAAGEEIKNYFGTAAQPDLTITFTAPKIANVLPPASRASKKLKVVNIGSPQELIDQSPSKLFLAEKDDAKQWLGSTRYGDDSYKNKRGHALLIAGSSRYAGAAVLCGNAAIRSGVGLVTIAAPASAQSSIAARVFPEIMTRGVSETANGAFSEAAFAEIEEFRQNVDVLAIGSGLSSSDESTKKLVRKVVENRKTPVVIDADGLNSLAPFDLQGNEDLPLILTPHEGEFLKLLGTKDREVLRDRVCAARDFAQKHNVILVLKGERTLIAEPGGRVVINPTGNSGLGKAGNGDNLTGIITGFVAQTMTTKHFKINFKFNVEKPLRRVFEAAVAAVYIAGLAGDIAERKFGKRVMIASDVRDCLAEAFEEIEREENGKWKMENERIS